MLKLDEKVIVDYLGFVLPKKSRGQFLSKLDVAVDQAVACAKKDDEKGLQSAMELIGRIMANRK